MANKEKKDDLEKELVESGNWTRIDEIVEPAATAIVKAEDDTLSSSCDVTAIPKMSADELHKEIIQTYVALAENVIVYQALVLSARERMHRGEKVGGCLTWTEYAENYLRRDGESLPTCLRRLARAIEGHNPDTKHDGSNGRKLFASSNFSDEDRKKEAAIRKAAQIPKDKPVQKSHIKAYDAGWYAGHTADIRREKTNAAINEKYHGDKNREKAIKSALGLPLNATVEKDKMTEYLSVYRAANDAGYDAGFREGQEQQMRYDLEHLPGTENLGIKPEKFEANSVPMPKGAL
jgi:hypothetical protein